MRAAAGHSLGGIMEEKFKEENERPERALLIGVNTKTAREDFEKSMEELASLAKACYMEPVGIITQRLESADKGLYIGAGKVQEVKEAVEALEADILLFDDTLTPSQLRNLQRELDRPILDRTTLILDIFETRARTREAKLQVESARLKYLLPRLVGMHKALTRQGGTTGSMSSRGAGEKKLELDRRRIEHRITELSGELLEVAKERKVQRRRRMEAGIPLVALVGYTNAGKSTIMNAMIDAYVKDEEKKVLEKDMLFATLDTTVRRINTGNNKDFLLSDTVGFIHKLPHGLVKAFHSTLEEVENADLLLHVVDYSDPFYREHMETTNLTLSELNTSEIPVITVFNKVDKKNGEMDGVQSYPQVIGNDKIYISARDTESVKCLTSIILERIYADYVQAEFLVPYEKGNIVSYFMEHSHIISQEYKDKGTLLCTKCHKADRNRYEKYLLQNC